MLLDLPVLVEYDTNAWERRQVRFNPAFVMTVEPDPDNPHGSILTLCTGTFWYLELTPDQYDKKAREYLKRNIMHLYHNGTKDNS